MKKGHAFLKRAGHWAFYRLSIRWPGPLARMTRELPLVAIEQVYSEAPPKNTRIPNIVYQTWVEPRLGRSHARALSAFRARNADFSFRFFDEVAMDDFMTAHFHGHEIYQIYNNARFGPMKADIWRYCVLYAHGGVYCDISRAIRRPLREFVDGDTWAVISFETHNPAQSKAGDGMANLLQFPGNRVINWALMSEPGHPLFERVIDGICSKYATYRGVLTADPKQAILEFTGPIHLSECLTEYVAAHGTGELTQAGVDFDGEAIIELPGSYVRYATRPAYILASDQVIVT